MIEELYYLQIQEEKKWKNVQLIKFTPRNTLEIPYDKDFREKSIKEKFLKIAEEKYKDYKSRIIKVIGDKLFILE